MVWFYDGPDVFVCNLWREGLPTEDAWGGYTQAQLDADRVDFETVWLADANGALSAKEGDGRAIVATYPGRIGSRTQFVGAGDDIAGGVVCAGPKLTLEFNGAETKTQDFQFLAPIQIADGAAMYSGTWDARDRLSLAVQLAANVPTANATNTGNCNAVPSGAGYDVLVPAAGDGAYDVDLATAIPLILDIDHGSTGAWWVTPDTGAITPALTGGGNVHLLCVPYEVWMARHCPLGAPNGHWDVEPSRAEYIHPRWNLHLEVVKTSAGAGILSGELLIYRWGG